MMTKKYDFIRCIIFLFLLLCPRVYVHAADVVSGSGSWTIGAEKLRFTQQQAASDSDNGVAEVMPKLILEQLAQNLERMPSAKEQLDRTLYDLQKARIDLFLQLSKESQTRDAIPGVEYGLNDSIKVNLAKVFEVAFEEMFVETKKSVEQLWTLFEKHLRLCLDTV